MYGCFLGIFVLFVIFTACSKLGWQVCTQAEKEAWYCSICQVLQRAVRRIPARHVTLWTIQSSQDTVWQVVNQLCGYLCLLNYYTYAFLCFSLTCVIWGVGQACSGGKGDHRSGLIVGLVRNRSIFLNVHHMIPKLIFLDCLKQICPSNVFEAFLLGSIFDKLHFV